MMKFRITAVAAILLFGFSVLTVLVMAGDEPHDNAYSVQCDSCHTGHTSLGSSLTNQNTNALVCQQCHDSTADYPMLDSYNNATPGTTGKHHRWAVSSTNTTYGASAPTQTEMSDRMDGTNIICSTCHNQHWTNNWGEMNPQGPYPLLADHTAGTGPNDGVSYEPASASPNPEGYLINFETSGGYSTAQYRVSYNNGSTWWGWDGTNWVEGNATPRTIPADSTTPQNLDNNSIANGYFDVTNGNFQTNDQYKFFLSYPFLRLPLDSGDNSTGNKFCRDCHSSRAQTYSDVRTSGWSSGTYNSHPVGQAMGASGNSYDRSEPRDVNGEPQSTSTDTNDTNNLERDSAGNIQCLTCHGVHYVDSNSNSKDGP